MAKFILPFLPSALAPGAVQVPIAVLLPDAPTVIVPLFPLAES